MWDDGHPRVLVVAALPFSSSTGGGITLSNLFHGWPRDRIAQLHTEGVPTTEVCERYFQLPPRNAPVEHHVRRLLDGLRRGGPGTARAMQPTVPAARPG
ncbi:hypothetical protein JNW88_29005, partial [Micromonospora sp. ATA32]|nr:hypothetical protein [Micromonospora sp. ATA32]